MFKKGFTLAEILVSLFLIAIIATILLRSVDHKGYQEKGVMAKALKAIDAIESATQQIKDLEDKSCPMRSFMENVTGVQTFVLMNADGTATANTNDVLALYAKYIKFENDALNFCDFSGYCSDSNIKGAKIVGGIYIGFMKNSSIFNCPEYYLPNDTTPIPAPSTLNVATGNFETTKCWGKAYIDANGLEGPNALGKDVFVFGMNGIGLAK